MAEKLKQAEGEEELLRQVVHKELLDAISKLLQQAEARDLAIILQFSKNIIG